MGVKGGSPVPAPSSQPRHPSVGVLGTSGGTGGTAARLEGTLQRVRVPMDPLAFASHRRWVPLAQPRRVTEAMTPPPRPHLHPHHRAGLLRVLPAPVPGAPLPLPGLTPHVGEGGQAVSARGTPTSPPLSAQ